MSAGPDSSSWQELFEKIRMEHDLIQMLELCNKLNEKIFAKQRDKERRKVPKSA